MNISWTLWSIWQIYKIIAETWNDVEGCSKWWDQSWHWRVIARGSYLDLKCKSYFIGGTITDNSADRTAQKQQQTWESDLSGDFSGETLTGVRTLS